MSWVDVLFPKRCVVCRDSGAYLCSECVGKFRVQDERICPMCGSLSMRGRTHSGCAKPQGLDGLVAGFEYTGVMRRMLGAYKYRLISDLTETLVELWVSMVDVDFLGSDVWVVVPVPLYVSRERWRGFNQAALLGQALADYYGYVFLGDGLERTRDTRVQMRLDREDRLVNMLGAFGSGSKIDEVRGRRVLLVDDVWTTGATMRECGKVLKRNGAKKVWGVVMAR